MGPMRYRATILPDGHLPLPDGYPGRAGDEIDVTLDPGPALPDEETARRQYENLRANWAGAAKNGPGDLARDHDEYLYGDR